MNIVTKINNYKMKCSFESGASKRNKKRQLQENLRNIPPMTTFFSQHEADQTTSQQINISESPTSPHTNISESPTSLQTNISESPTSPQANISELPISPHKNISESPTSPQITINECQIPSGKQLS